MLLDFFVHNATPIKKSSPTNSKTDSFPEGDPLAEKQVFLKQQIKLQRDEITGFKQETRELRDELREKQRILTDLRDRVRYLESNKRDLEANLMKQVKKERDLAETNEKNKETIIHQRNSIIMKRLDDKSMEKSVRDFERNVLESMEDYLSKKRKEDEETPLEKSPLLKKIREKTEKIERTLNDELQKQHEDEKYKEIEELLKNPMEKTANIGYSGARKKLKLIYGKMISQGNSLTNMEDELKKNIDGGNLLASQKTLQTIGSESESSMEESKISMKESTLEKKKPRLNGLKKRTTAQIIKLEKQVQTLQIEDVPMALILKCQTLEENNKALTTELEKLKSDINDKIQTIENFKVLAQNSLKTQCDLQDSQIKISNLQKEYNGKCQEISLFEGKVEKKKNKIQELKQHMEELKEKKVNMSVSQFLITKNDEIEKYVQEIQDLKKNNSELKEQLKESTKMNKEYKEELSSAIFSPDTNRRKSSFFPSADVFTWSTKGDTPRKLDVIQGDVFKKVEKHANFQPILPETEIQSSENNNDPGLMRRASDLPLKTEEGIEDADFSLGKALKRGSAIVSQKDSEFFIRMAKKQMKKKKQSAVKIGKKSFHFDHQNGANPEIIQESLTTNENILDTRKSEENTIQQKGTSQERIELIDGSLMIQQTQANILNQDKDDSKNEDRQGSSKNINQNSPIKIRETPKVKENVILTPQKREGIPLQKKKASLAKQKQDFLQPTQNTEKDLLSQRTSGKLDFPPETNKTINRPNIDSNKEISKSLNKTSELPISKPKTQIEIGKKPSSFHISTSTEIQSLSKIASSPEHPQLTNHPQAILVPMTKKSPANFQKQLNNLLSNEKNSIDKQLSANSVSVHFNPLQKATERFVKTTFFSPNQKTQIDFSMDFTEKPQKQKRKHLTYVSIPNIFYIYSTRQADKSPDTNSLNSRNFSENKFPLLKNITSKNRIDHYKAKINNIIGDQLNILTEVNLSNKKPSFYDFEKTNSEIFPNVSTKIKREIQFLTKRKDDDKNIGTKPQNTEIRDFFDDNQNKSFYEDNTPLNNGVHRRNNSDHQLQLLNINFSKIKEKIDPNAIFHGLQEKKLEEIYEKLEETEENKELLEQIKGKNEEIKPNFNNFKKFVRDFEKEHKKCGRNCSHLKRFYQKLGLEKEKREVFLLHKRDLK